MKVAPFRALTPVAAIFIPPKTFSRNEGRPIQGIDTFHFFSGQPASVCRNEGRPIQGITTPALTHMLS